MLSIFFFLLRFRLLQNELCIFFSNKFSKFHVFDGVESAEFPQRNCCIKFIVALLFSLHGLVLDFHLLYKLVDVLLFVKIQFQMLQSAPASISSFLVVTSKGFHLRNISWTVPLSRNVNFVLNNSVVEPKLSLLTRTRLRSLSSGKWTGCAFIIIKRVELTFVVR